jgi:hypothetical protein
MRALGLDAGLKVVAIEFDVSAAMLAQACRGHKNIPLRKTKQSSEMLALLKDKTVDSIQGFGDVHIAENLFSVRARVNANWAVQVDQRSGSTWHHFQLITVFS